MKPNKAEQKIEAAKQKLNAHLEARTNVVFDPQKTVLVDYKIEPDIVTLEEIKQHIASQILEFEKFTSFEWEKFLLDYIAYSAAKSKINKFDVKFMMSFVGSNSKGEVFSNFLMLNAEYLIPPKEVEDLVDILDTIDHEITHLSDEKYLPVTYQKFDNEEGYMPQSFTPSRFHLLQNLLSPEHEKTIKNLSTEKYFFNEWEIHARKVALERLAEMAQAMLEQTKNLNLLSHMHTRKIARTFDNHQMFLHKKEQERAEKAKETVKNWPIIKQEFYKLLPVLKEKKDYYTDNDGLKQQILYNLPDMIGLVNLPELYCQQAFDDVFEFMLEHETINCLAFYEIINASRNAHSKEMLCRAYQYFAKSGSNTLRTYHENLKEAGRQNASLFGSSSIDEKYFNQQFLLQRQILSANRHK